ncbi:hypothetical protein KGM_207494 [Danaus plexippus plexippus]|uniref:Uncharacterized protein n=1 Tax=Danaus plexippus plexippus TaxID=278856 RepID=A0A212FHH1_DANPL|nr:hypothetical protein KGM_207494 [Danaus plexippus plexippus]
MVQEYVSPVRVHKYPFEMVMASTNGFQCTLADVSPDKYLGSSEPAPEPGSPPGSSLVWSWWSPSDIS